MAWIEASDETRMHLSVLTLGELAKGVARLPTSAKRKRLQAWLERDLLARFAERIVPIDGAAVPCPSSTG
jgi:predicted nucleic acid-binding protein